MTSVRGLLATWLLWRAHRLRERAKRATRNGLIAGQRLKARADAAEAKAKKLQEPKP